MAGAVFGSASAFSVMVAAVLAGDALEAGDALAPGDALAFGVGLGEGLGDGLGVGLARFLPDAGGGVGGAGVGGGTLKRR